MELLGHIAPPLAVLTAVKWAGVTAAASAGALALVARDRRIRSAAMLAAILLTPVLLVGEIWGGSQVRDLRADPAKAAALGAAAAVAVVVLALLFRRRPRILPLAIVAVLPFRLPIAAGDTTANLLVPLYLVIAGGVLASAIQTYGSTYRPASGKPSAGLAVGGRAVGPVEWLLAAALVLYAVQSAYTNDFKAALEQVVFFLVPFALMARLLLDSEWDGRLLRALLLVVTVEALAFTTIGFWEYEARHLLWNPKVINSNQFESYFRVNSVFWDPNIYGRYLVMVMLALTAVLVWIRDSARILLVGLVLAILWAGLVLTFSQSSFAALLAGLAVLAAIRWSGRWTLVASGLAVVGALVFVAAFGSTVKLNLASQKSLDRATSGRVDLIRGGLDIASEKPVWGHGSGSFARTYRREKRAGSREAVSASHTEPVTVVAEQGPVGLAVYAGLLVAAFAALLAGLAPAARQVDDPLVIGRAAIVAAFGALVFHSLAYAAFLTDPITWVLLAGGVALQRRALAAAARESREPSGSALPAPA